MPSAPAVLHDIATRHQVYLESLKGSQKEKISEFLRQVDKDIRRRLNGDITAFTRSRLEVLLDRVGKDIETVTGEYLAQLRQDLVDLAVYEADFELRSLNQVVDYQFTIPSTNQLVSAAFTAPLSASFGGSNLLDPFMDGLTDRARDRITNEIRLGYYQGDSTSRVLQRIRGTRARGYRDGIISRVDFDAETIARTALQHASEQSRNELYRQNADIVKEVIWISTLDSKTSEVCRGLDRQVFPLEEGPRPPAHPRCRSKTIPRLDSRYDFLDEGGTRIARDSEDARKIYKVPEKTTYYEWLKKQPVSFQDSVLGPTRGKLLRDGGISAKRFQELQLDKNFKPRTLKEIAELDPVAFESAGLNP